MNKSESIANLSKALVTFHSKVSSVKKDAENPYFKSKYATLDNFIETINKPLQEAKLSFSQFPDGVNGLTTILMHSSGEWIESRYEMTPSKNDPQGLGSAITYMRRYALGAVLGLATEEDDDANTASTKTETKKAIPESLKKEISEATSTEQLKTIWEENKGLGKEFAALITAQKKFIQSVKSAEEAAIV